MRDRDTTDGSPADEAPDGDALVAEARLARLTVPAERRAAVLADRERILAAFESLRSVDVADVEPLHQPLVGPGGERNTRAEPGSTDALLDRDLLFDAAPRAVDEHFAVPKTVDA